MKAKADAIEEKTMNAISEGWTERYGRALAAEALKTYRNREDALLAIQRPGELQRLWGHTDNPRMPSHIEDGPLTPILRMNIKMRLEAEGCSGTDPSSFGGTCELGRAKTEDQMRKIAKISNKNGVQTLELPAPFRFPGSAHEVGVYRHEQCPECLVLVPPPLVDASSAGIDGAEARLEEISALTLSWRCLDVGERAERCLAVLKRVQALAAVECGS